MPAIGYLQIRAYTSYAQLPVVDAAVSVIGKDGATALRMTDRSGQVPPLAISVPDKSESQQPAPDEQPFGTVNLTIRKPGFEILEASNVQIFADTTTLFNAEMIPLSELPGGGYGGEYLEFNTPPQNL